MDDRADEVGEVTTIDAAIAWCDRVRARSATAEDWAALTFWLEASPEHLAAFEAAENVITDIDDLTLELRAAINRPSAQILSFPPRPKSAASRKPQRALIAAAAAGFVLALGAGAWRFSEGALEVYRTAPGETRSMTLADGSHIELDAATTLSARLGWFSRQLRLSEGEASFDVAKDAGRPLTVAVGDQKVRVVGTEFNIGDDAGTVDVTVRRGVVSVYQAEEDSTPVARLTPGWTLEHRIGARGSVVRQVDPDIAFAWMSGKLVCMDEPLPRIAAHLDRRYGIPLRLSPAAAGKRFSGVLELGDQDEVVRHIAAYLSLSIHRSKTEIRLD